jgi:uncharacterized membrane protein YvlD (DUF360 family)
VSPARLLRAALVLLADALMLLLLAGLLPGFHLDRPAAAVTAAVAVGALNAVVWPLLARLALPLSVVTLGLATLVLNGVLVVFAIDLVPGASIEDVWTGVGVAIGMALLTTLLASLLAIDEDESWYRNVVRRQARRRGDRTESDVPGVIFLEIDGLAHEVLRRAMRDGNAPTLARWLREGSHRFVRWETDWSSQTGACQAGLLHGNNDDMPAFRWWEKDRGVSIVTSYPRDAEELEAAPLGRTRAAARGRREPREHHVRGRDPLDAHDEHGPPPAATDRARLLGVLREPVRRGANVRTDPGRNRG